MGGSRPSVACKHIVLKTWYIRHGCSHVQPDVLPSLIMQFRGREVVSTGEHSRQGCRCVEAVVCICVTRAHLQAHNPQAQISRWQGHDDELISMGAVQGATFQKAQEEAGCLVNMCSVEEATGFDARQRWTSVQRLLTIHKPCIILHIKHRSNASSTEFISKPPFRGIG